MALGRKASTEPLSSEDMALLAAVAAQAATALENGRLYRQLQVKADELDRMREFSENILESLNDGLAVVNRDDRVVRWNRRLEELYGVRHEEAVGRRLDEILDAGFFEVLRSARRESPDGAALLPRAARRRGTTPPRRLLVNVATTPLRDIGRARSPGRSSSSRTSRRACSSKSSCRSPRRWRRSACSPPAWRTRSTRR